VVHRTVAISPWYPEHTGLRIAVISDLHVGSPYRGLSTLTDLVNTTNAEKPDLVVMLGDFVVRGVAGGHFVEPEQIAEQLAALHAPLGVVSVLGNHDWWYDGLRVRSALESHGIRVLENENIRLTYREKSLWLCGLADFWTRDDQLARTLAKIDNGEPVLALMHNPDIFPEMPKRVSLSLAGHTHGGQVNLPFLGRLIVPSRFGARYAYGLIEEDGKKLFVTGGIGTSIWPVRFRVPPEIVVLTLVERML
jgi:predicted MPP superfamily phosphohydrolase